MPVEAGKVPLNSVLTGQAYFVAAVFPVHLRKLQLYAIIHVSGKTGEQK